MTSLICALITGPKIPSSLLRCFGSSFSVNESFLNSVYTAFMYLAPIRVDVCSKYWSLKSLDKKKSIMTQNEKKVFFKNTQEDHVWNIWIVTINLLTRQHAPASWVHSPIQFLQQLYSTSTLCFVVVQQLSFFATVPQSLHISLHPQNHACQLQ